VRKPELVMVPRWFAAKPEADRAVPLYARAMEQARQPGFYRNAGVPDSFDGRFEMIALHVFLLLRRLRGDRDQAAPALAQALVDTLFADMDRTLRGLGAADLGVGRRVRRMAEAFYGRVAAYDQGLDGGPDALADALRRNLYGTVADEPSADQLGMVADYLRQAIDTLAGQGLATLLDGGVTFPPAP
jgi:cytochrome b pre-mRNA-processing protein 3